MAHRTFAAPDLTTFTGLDALGLTTSGHPLTAQAATLQCRAAEPDPWCTHCGAMGASRGTITSRPTHVPYGHRPATLLLRIRRYTCTGCGRFWQEDTSRAAPARAKLTRTTPGLGATGPGAGPPERHNRVAEILGVSWNTANTAILGKGQRRLIKDATRFDGVTVLGVDERVWHHTRRVDKYVIVIIDHTPPSRTESVQRGCWTWFRGGRRRRSSIG